MPNYNKIRSFQPPTGWTIPPDSSVISNEYLDAIYPYFSGALAKITNTYTQNLKKGQINDFPNTIKYGQIGLYVLSRWYNGCFTFTIPSQVSGNFTVSIYYVPSEVVSINQPLVVTINATSISNLMALLTTSLPQGWVVTNNGNTITLESVNALQQYLYIALINGASSYTVYSQIDYVSYPYSVIQQIVETMSKICLCPDTKTTEDLESDFIYTSLGRTPPSPISGFSNYTNYLYE